MNTILPLVPNISSGPNNLRILYQDPQTARTFYLVNGTLKASMPGKNKLYKVDLHKIKNLSSNLLSPADLSKLVEILQHSDFEDKFNSVLVLPNGLGGRRFIEKIHEQNYQAALNQVKTFGKPVELTDNSLSDRKILIDRDIKGNVTVHFEKNNAEDFVQYDTSDLLIAAGKRSFTAKSDHYFRFTHHDISRKPTKAIEIFEKGRKVEEGREAHLEKEEIKIYTVNVLNKNTPLLSLEKILKSEYLLGTATFGMFATAIILGLNSITAGIFLGLCIADASLLGLNFYKNIKKAKNSYPNITLQKVLESARK